MRQDTITSERAGRRTASPPAKARGPEPFRSLLVPVDLTPSSDRVLGRVARLPLADDARITVLHVVPGTLAPRDQRIAARDAEKALAEEARHLRESLARTVDVESIVSVGAAAKEIAAHARSAKAELIVMGRGGGRALRDLFLGSTAERVIRQSKLPVLVVRLPPRAAYARPAVALDLHQPADEVLRLLLRVLRPPRPRVTVIHAFEPPYHGVVYPSLSRDEADERKDRFQLEAAQELSALLTRSLERAKVRPGDVAPWKTHIRFGSPRLVIEKAVEKAETDLLVLGTHGYSGVAHMFLGTVAGDVLREVPCDVLVVPPRARAPVKSRAAP